MTSRLSIEETEIETVAQAVWEADPRYLLLQRILATPEFIRSPQLSKFLLYICIAMFEGRGQSLSEQHIGVEVFGRKPDYDSAADTIVRSHALRLRRRLEQFFQRAGRHEPLQLIVPRGGYIPLFSIRPEHLPGEERRVDTTSDPDSLRLPQDVENTSPIQVASLDDQADQANLPQASQSSLVSPTLIGKTSPDRILVEPDAAVLSRYRVTTVILVFLCVALMVALGLHWRTPLVVKRHHILWGRLFTDDQPTQIVLGDSGLVLFHAVSRQYVSLHDYLGDDVSKQMPFVEHVEPQFAEFLRHRRYTSMVDANTLTHLLRLPEAIPDRTLVHYSRDMHLNDFKTANIIMIGAQEAVPWVELFESHMNFAFTIDHPYTHTSFVNRHPATGELEEYSSFTPGTRTKVYAVVAFLPNLSETGNVLILEGLTMGGTEAAVDLATDDDRLLPILNKIRKPNGSLPHFEMLLESDMLGESAGPARVVSLHLHE